MTEKNTKPSSTKNSGVAKPSDAKSSGEVKKKEDKKCCSGLGLAIVAAAAAAGYFLYGSKKSAGNRKKIKGWTLKAKGEVLERIEKLKDVSEDEYNKIIDSVSAKYSKMKDVDEDEVKESMNDLRKYWKNIQKEIEPKKKKAKKIAKKAINKAAKKIVKKTAEKRPTKTASAKSLPAGRQGSGVAKKKRATRKIAKK